MEQEIKALLGKAQDRGYARGCADINERYYNPEPLSGEWAGESINELLGDILSVILAYGDEFYDEVCEHYEFGYFQAQQMAPEGTFITD